MLSISDIIIQVMDEAGKKKLAAAKKLIQEGKHAEAL